MVTMPFTRKNRGGGERNLKLVKPNRNGSLDSLDASTSSRSTCSTGSVSTNMDDDDLRVWPFQSVSGRAQSLLLKNSCQTVNKKQADEGSVWASFRAVGDMILGGVAEEGEDDDDALNDMYRQFSREEDKKERDAAYRSFMSQTLGVGEEHESSMRTLSSDGGSTRSLLSRPSSRSSHFNPLWGTEIELPTHFELLDDVDEYYEDVCEAAAIMSPGY